MSENEMLINRDRNFYNNKYIIGKKSNLQEKIAKLIILVAEIDRGEESEIHWDGRLQRLRDYLSLTVDEQSKTLKLNI